MEDLLRTLSQLGSIAIAYLAIRYVILPIYRTGALDPAIELLSKVETDVPPMSGSLNIHDSRYAPKGHSKNGTVYDVNPHKHQKTAYDD